MGLSVGLTDSQLEENAVLLGTRALWVFSTAGDSQGAKSQGVTVRKRSSGGHVSLLSCSTPIVVTSKSTGKWYPSVRSGNLYSA